MTEKEQYLFFRLVVGRRIRWSRWDRPDVDVSYTYFVPTSMEQNGEMRGLTYSVSASSTRICTGERLFIMGNGFRSSYSEGWYYYSNNKFVVFNGGKDE